MRIRALIIFLLSAVATTAFADDDTNDNKYTRYIGQSLWVNPRGVGITVYAAPDILSKSSRIETKKKFFVIEEIGDKERYGVQSPLKWLRVKFDDGTEAYLSPLVLASSVGDPKVIGPRALLSEVLPDDPDKLAADFAKLGGVSVGMTIDQALRSNWGPPLHKNITATGTVRHEQWVYPGHAYLYFQNGKVTAIQQRQ